MKTGKSMKRSGNRKPKTNSRVRERGFTLLEMVIVISIILILVSIAIPNYVTSMRRAREAVLKDDLFQLRSVIDQYTLDKQAAPMSLSDLVNAGYLREIPRDPMTKKSDWVLDQCDAQMSIDHSQTGVCDVHSASNEIGLN